MELNYILYSLGAIAALCTSFYMFRLYYLVFAGKFRGDHHTWHHHVHEHWIMSLPLVVLAVLATFGGLLGWPHVLHGIVHIPHVLEEWLEPITRLSSTFHGELVVGVRQQFLHEGHVSGGMELLGMAVGLAVGITGWVLARRLYLHGPSEQAAMLAKRFRLAYAASSAKYWVDEIYDVLVVKPVRIIGTLCYQVGDMLLIDGVGVQGTAGAVGVAGGLVKGWHNGNVRRYLLALLFGTAVLLGVVYLNPQISRSDLMPKDASGERHLRPDIGLRRTLGPQSVNMELFWGLWKVHLPGKAEQDGGGRLPAPGQILRPPAPPPAQTPDGAAGPGGKP
jgi:NADH-quinone oxidoreductase subunit L